MGEVSAPSYFAARQTATNTCLSYAQVKQPSPAVVAPANGVVPQVPAGFTNLNAAGAVSATPLPENLTISSGQAQQGCSECVCD
jgi:hypothetical protein